VDRQKLRRLATPLPLGVASLGLINYVVGEKILGEHRGGLAALGVVFVLAWVVGSVLRRASGLTWLESLWPRLDPTPWEQLPPSMASVNELAQAGLTIQAVKMHRDLTGADLRTALDAVNAMRARRSVEG
jgi:hypothetical protein